MTEPSHTSRLRRLLLNAGGWLCIALGALGVVLPLLPTTPFLLLAAACFTRSSPRAHQWLLSNKHFGPLLRQWNRTREISASVKVKAITVTAITFAASIAVVDGLPLRIVLLCVACCVLVFLMRIPTTAPDVELGRHEEAH